MLIQATWSPYRRVVHNQIVEQGLVRRAYPGEFRVDINSENVRGRLLEPYFMKTGYTDWGSNGKVEMFYALGLGDFALRKISKVKFLRKYELLPSTEFLILTESQASRLWEAEKLPPNLPLARSRQEAAIFEQCLENYRYLLSQMVGNFSDYPFEKFKHWVDEWETVECPNKQGFLVIGFFINFLRGIANVATKREAMIAVRDIFGELYPELHQSDDWILRYSTE